MPSPRTDVLPPRWTQLGQRVIDVSAGVGAVGFGLLAAQAGTGDPSNALHLDRLVLTTVAFGTAVGIFWRRRAPVLVGLLASVGFALAWSLVAMVIGVYTVAAERGNRPVTWLVTGAAVVATVYRPLPAGGAAGISRAVVALTLAVLPALLGLYVAARRAILRNLVDRAQRLEREQVLAADRARTQERTRIAREMHDVVAHRVSLMVLHAGALGLVARSEPDKVATTAETIRLTGRQALEELRSLIGVLRVGEHEDAAPTAPQPTLANLPALIEDWRGIGLPVTMSIEGPRRPAGEQCASAAPGSTGELRPGWECLDDDRHERSAAAERTAFRVAQEALTNVNKHAAGAETTVSIRYRDGAVQVRVTNALPPGSRPDGPGSPPGGDSGTASAGSGTTGTASISAEPLLPSGGHGLIGLQERVSLAGGDFIARSRLDGGFEVVARIPDTVT